MANDGSHFIYIGRLLVTADIAAYAAQTQAGWKQYVQTGRLKPPYSLLIRTTDVGVAVTTAALQAKLQHAALRPKEAPSAATVQWKDAEEVATAIETPALTAAGFENSNKLTEQLAELARVLVKGTSADWQTDGQYWDVWLAGSAR